MISIFSAINEVAVVGTSCLMMAVHTLWYALPFQGSDETETSVKSVRQNTWTTSVTFVSLLFVLGFVSYVLSFASVLKMSTIQIGSALALFSVATHVALTNAPDRSFMWYINNAGFMIVSIIGGAYVLNYWPW